MGILTELSMKTQKILKSMDFSVKRKGIIEQAKKNGAIQDVLRELYLLPGRKYDNVEEIDRELHMVYMEISV